MPLYGTLDITANAKALPTLGNLDTEAWALPKAEMLQLLIEVPRSTTEGLLPKAMHPALPSYVILAVTKYSESPVGPFNLAVLRLGSRAGAHPRGFLLGAIASTEKMIRMTRPNTPSVRLANRRPKVRAPRARERQRSDRISPATLAGGVAGTVALTT